VHYLTIIFPKILKSLAKLFLKKNIFFIQMGTEKYLSKNPTLHFQEPDFSTRLARKVLPRVGITAISEF
jgi:hypothetical protein